MQLARSFLMHSAPLAIGREAPHLSLTAQDGTWVQMRDFKGKKHIVLAFFDRTDLEVLRRLDGATEALDELDAVAMGVNQDHPNKLRESAAEAGVDLLLLYDVLAWTSRAYGQAGRRPYTRAGLVIVDKQGRIALHSRDADPLLEVLDTLRDLQGVAEAEEKEAEASNTVIDLEWAEAIRLMEAKDAGHIVLDVRTGSEYQSGHVPGSAHIPVDELPNRHGELGSTKRVLCVCQTGSSSTAAAIFLTSVGYTEVYNVLSGMSGFSGETETD